MRTRITILRGQIEGMADGIFTPDEAMFASLADDLDRLQRLADDLSSLSRAEEGASILHAQPHRRDHAGADHRRVTAPAVRRRPGHPRRGPRPAGRRLLDPGRITQVLVNLLGNALRRMRSRRPGGVAVRTGGARARM